MGLTPLKTDDRHAGPVTIRFYWYQDFDIKDISKAFAVRIEPRLFDGVPLGETMVNPLANGVINIPIPLPGGLQGRIDDWQGYRSDGSRCQQSDWSDAAQVRFLATLVGIVHYGPLSFKIALTHSELEYTFHIGPDGQPVHPLVAAAADAMTTVSAQLRVPADGGGAPAPAGRP